MIDGIGGPLEAGREHLDLFVENIAPAIDDIEVVHDQLEIAIGAIVMANQALENVARSSTFGHALLVSAKENAETSARLIGPSNILGTANHDLRSLPEFISHLVGSSTNMADVLLQSLKTAGDLMQVLNQSKPALVELHEKTRGQAANLRTRRAGTVRRSHALQEYLDEHF